MSQATQRRTDADRLRQTISAMLEQTDAIEYSMQQFYRKGSHAELERASMSYDAMLAYVDRLGEILAAAHRRESAELVPTPKPLMDKVVFVLR
jgi:hypothetical protein